MKQPLSKREKIIAVVTALLTIGAVFYIVF